MTSFLGEENRMPERFWWWYHASDLYYFIRRVFSLCRRVI